MIPILRALIPIFALIGLGFLFQRHRFPTPGFWLGAERLAYYALFPPLLIRHLATAPVVGASLAPLAATIAATVLSLSLLLFATRRFLGADGPAFSSVFQGSVRFNTFVGLAATASLYPAGGLAIASLILAMLIPLVNVLSVTVLAHNGHGAKPAPGPWRIAGKLVRNPLIIGCAIGIALNLGGIGLPASADLILKPLARAALPIGLLVVGSGFSPSAVRGSTGLIGLTTVLKLIASPAIATGVCLLLGLHGTPAQVMILFSALPGASSAYILAGQMGGDRKLMAAILTVQTTCAVLTLPMVIVLTAPLCR